MLSGGQVWRGSQASQRTQLNGEAAKAKVEACHTSMPPSAPASRNVRPMSWYSGSHEQPMSPGDKLIRSLSPRRLASTAAGVSCAARACRWNPAVPCRTAERRCAPGGRVVERWVCAMTA